MKKLEMKGAGVVTDQAEVDRNLALLDEVLLRLQPMVDSNVLLARTQKVLQIKQEHESLVSGLWSPDKESVL